MTDDLDNKSICETEGCGNWVHRTKFTCVLSPILSFQHQVSKCDLCLFLESFRLGRLVRNQPYKKPGHRPTAQGGIPDAVKKEIEQWNKQQEEIEAKQREVEEARRKMGL